MSDIDKFIVELENLPPIMHAGFYQLRMTHNLRYEIIKLLKEQKDGITPVYVGINYMCGNCHNPIEKGKDNYCSVCGKKIKWTTD